MRIGKYNGTEGWTETSMANGISPNQRPTVTVYRHFYVTIRLEVTGTMAMGICQNDAISPNRRDVKNKFDRFDDFRDRKEGYAFVSSAILKSLQLSHDSKFERE